MASKEAREAAIERASAQVQSNPLVGRKPSPQEKQEREAEGVVWPGRVPLDVFAGAVWGYMPGFGEEVSEDVEIKFVRDALVAAVEEVGRNDYDHVRSAPSSPEESPGEPCTHEDGHIWACSTCGTFAPASSQEGSEGEALRDRLERIAAAAGPYAKDLDDSVSAGWVHSEVRACLADLDRLAASPPPVTSGEPSTADRLLDAVAAFPGKQFTVSARFEHYPATCDVRDAVPRAKNDWPELNVAATGETVEEAITRALDHVTTTDAQEAGDVG